MNSKVTIVMYHYVRDTNNTIFPGIKALSTANFSKQVKYFKRQYDFISIDELVGVLNGEHELPPNPILLTFDDGYIDHYDNVYPILIESNISGCFYPSGKAIDESIVLDVNKIHFILASAGATKRIINEIFRLLDTYRVEYDLKENRYYYNKLAKPNDYDHGDIIFIKRLLQRELDHNLRRKIIDKLFRKYITSDEKGFSEMLYVRRNHLVEMNNNGMHIGSHGYDHYWLDDLTEDEQERDIKKSLIFLQSISSEIKNLTMCFPYGARDKFTIEIIKRLKFDAAFAVVGRVADLKKDCQLELPRIDTNEFKNL